MPRFILCNHVIGHISRVKYSFSYPARKVSEGTRWQGKGRQAPVRDCGPFSLLFLPTQPPTLPGLSFSKPTWIPVHLHPFITRSKSWAVVLKPFIGMRPGGDSGGTSSWLQLVLQPARIFHTRSPKNTFFLKVEDKEEEKEEDVMRNSLPFGFENAFYCCTSG